MCISIAIPLQAHRYKNALRLPANATSHPQTRVSVAWLVGKLNRQYGIVDRAAFVDQIRNVYFAMQFEDMHHALDKSDSFTRCGYPGRDGLSGKLAVYLEPDYRKARNKTWYHALAHKHSKSASWYRVHGKLIIETQTSYLSKIGCFF
eukprot:708400_1